MIWIALVAAVFVLGGAWFIAKSMPTRIGVLVIGLGAVAIYWTLGRPDMGDLPLDARIAEIEARERDNPESVTAQDFLVMQEALAIADKIASLSQPVIAAAKEAINQAFEKPLADGLRHERLRAVYRA